MTSRQMTCIAHAVVFLLAVSFGACGGGGSNGRDADPDATDDTVTDVTEDVPADVPEDMPVDEPEDVPSDEDDADGPACDRGTWTGSFFVGTDGTLDDLAGYTAVQNRLEVGECATCTDLDALICLTTIGEEMVLRNNPLLENVDGLRSLTSVPFVSIRNNPMLAGLDGLAGLTSIPVNLTVTSTGVTSLEGLHNVTSIGEVTIQGNSELTSLDGLRSLTRIFTHVQIYGNERLPDCEVCQMLEQLTSSPTTIGASGNLDDTCTPVPDSCP